MDTVQSPSSSNSRSSSSSSSSSSKQRESSDPTSWYRCSLCVSFRRVWTGGRRRAGLSARKFCCFIVIFPAYFYERFPPVQIQVPANNTATFILVLVVIRFLPIPKPLEENAAPGTLNKKEMLQGHAQPLVGLGTEMETRRLDEQRNSQLQAPLPLTAIRSAVILQDQPHHGLKRTLKLLVHGASLKRGLDNLPDLGIHGAEEGLNGFPQSSGPFLDPGVTFIDGLRRKQTARGQQVLLWIGC